VQATVPPQSVIPTAAPDRGELVTVVASKRRRLLFTGDDDELLTRSLISTLRQIQQNSI